MTSEDQQAFALLREFYHEIRWHCRNVDRGIETLQEFHDGIEFDVSDLGERLEYLYERSDVVAADDADR